MTKLRFTYLKPLIRALILYCAFLDVKAQVPVSRFYDPETRKIIRESWFVTSDTCDTCVRQGLYRYFSREGLILREYNYDAGVIRGKKLEREEKTALLSFIGRYRKNGDYWGFNFHFTEDPKYMSFSYEGKKNGLALKKCDLKQLQFLVDSLHNLLIREKAGETEVYSKYLSRNDYLIERLFINGESQKILLPLGGFILYKFFTLAEDLTAFRDNDKMISHFIEKADYIYKRKLPSIYNKLLKQMLADISLYRQSDSIEEGFSRGFVIVNRIKHIEPLLDQTVKNDSLLKARRSFLAGHYALKPGLGTLYRTRILPFLEKINNNFGIVDSLELRIEYGMKLLAESSPYELKFGELELQDSTIHSSSKTEFSLFAKYYPGVFRDDLALYRNLIRDYDSIPGIEKKLTSGDALIKTLTQLIEKTDTLNSQQKYINNKFPVTTGYYRLQQPGIYKNEIMALADKVNKYLMLDAINERISLGRDIMEQGDFYALRIDSLKVCDTGITRVFALVRQDFERDYENIYKKDIQPLELRVNAYKNINHVSEKIRTGNELLGTLKAMGRKHDRLQAQLIIIDSLLGMTSLEYKKAYPNIRKVEISGIRQSWHVYLKMDALEPRLGNGNEIIKHLEYLHKAYDTVVYQDTILSRRLSAMKKELSDAFPGIYREMLIPMLKQKEAFNDQPSVKQMCETGRDLLKKVLGLSTRHPEITSQQKDLISEYNRFVGLFKNDKKRSILYKKGIILYEFYRGQYQAAGNVELCLEQGNDLMSILKKINSFADEDCVDLIDRLKKNSKPEEIRKAFGI